MKMALQAFVFLVIFCKYVTAECIQKNEAQKLIMCDSVLGRNAQSLRSHEFDGVVC